MNATYLTNTVISEVFRLDYKLIFQKKSKFNQGSEILDSSNLIFK